MGYIIRDIADVTEPQGIALSALPNWLQIASKTSTGQPFEGTLLPVSASAITITVADASGGLRTFTGTDDAEDVGGSVFYISSDALATAENLRAALMADIWLAANFDIWVPLTTGGGNTVRIRSKANGEAFELTITATGATYTNITHSTSDDSLRGEADVVDIAVDVYAVDGIAFGADDTPSGVSFGRYLVTLSKSFEGSPIWFDLNAVNAGPSDVPPPPVTGWATTGTASAFRAVAIRGGLERLPFYVSNVIWAVSGYGWLSGDNDLQPYVYEGTMAQLLTERPETTYIRGQREYLNAIIKRTGADHTLAVRYTAKDATGATLGVVVSPTVSRNTLAAVSTFALDIDAALDLYPEAYRVDVELVRDAVAVSNAQRYTVWPECLHAVRQLFFINRLGGWDAYNFDAPAVRESKASADVYSRTVTPSYAPAQGIEGVQATQLEDETTIQGAPVAGVVEAWLRDNLAASPMVLDGQHRRVILTEFNTRVAAEGLHAPTVKYRLSDKYGI